MSKVPASSLSSSFPIWMLLQFQLLPEQVYTAIRKNSSLASIEIATEAYEKYM